MKEPESLGWGFDSPRLHHLLLGNRKIWILLGNVGQKRGTLISLFQPTPTAICDRFKHLTSYPPKGLITYSKNHRFGLLSLS